MAKAKKRTARKTSVKKTWYSILAPKMFNEQSLGETLLAEPSDAVGRNISVNLMNLTRDIKKQNITVTFKIKELAGSKFHTEFIGYDMLPSSIKRFVRRGKKKADYTFSAITADGCQVKLKAIIVTRNDTANSTVIDLRRLCKENTKEMFSKMKYDAIANELVIHKIQSILKKKLDKIYPLKTMEFKHFSLTKKGVKVPDLKKQEKPAKKEPSEETEKQEKPKRSEDKKE